MLLNLNIKDSLVWVLKILLDLIFLSVIAKFISETLVSWYNIRRVPKFQSLYNNLVRARKRQNIIKISSHKSWQLSHQTLKGMHNALIRSTFSYYFFSLARIAESNLNRLQRFQNRAIRSIYRLEWNSPTIVIHAISNSLPIRERLLQLAKRYLLMATDNNNANVCLLLQEYIDSKSSIRRKEKDTPLCLF